MLDIVLNALFNRFGNAGVERSTDANVVLDSAGLGVVQVLKIKNLAVALCALMGFTLGGGERIRFL